ncbi:hypothetical protein CE91St30_01310 [Raoultibacter timonensis]|uniref:Uncharacterized protein n=1 Tax=Raoultibacter timonensis TaxID=1907662 RepID=A0ABN6ME34_9ACTN|nr:hypothetical protein CE91St30_01310 [Raoultibacter timonensis]BDF49401.1 hypothetical protein CE91St31_01310 [Raoultibacter timonensis]
MPSSPRLRAQQMRYRGGNRSETVEFACATRPWAVLPYALALQRYTATSPMPSTCMTRSATVSTVTMATVAQMRMRVTGLLL